ncbi:MAG: CBS domain-containing protein [Phycisphaerae bacterium]
MNDRCSDTSVLMIAAPSPELLFGLMLAAALIGGYAVRLVHVPRVVGFLLAGVGLRVLLYGLAAQDDGGIETRSLEAAAGPLSAIKDLALGLILFTIGGVFERSQLRPVGARILKIGLLDVSMSFAVVLVGCIVVLLLGHSGADLQENITLALLLAAASIATAPAATLFVLQEYESKGPITDTICGLTAVNNIVCIVLFHALFLILASLGAITATGGLAGRLLGALALTTIGSVGLGIICGTTLGIVHGKLPIPETLLVFFALVLLLGSGEKWLLEQGGLSYNFLLTALVTGAVFANVAIDPLKLTSALRTMSTPILAGFFVIAGYGLRIEQLGAMGWVGGVYVVCRVAGKMAGGHFGARWAGGPAVGRRLGGALLCQAAVVIGLAAFVDRYWDSDLAAQFSTVVLGSVVLFELIGPLLVKRCVVYGGEVKAITLLSRTGRSTEGASIVRLTVQSLLRLLPWGPNSQRGTPEAVSVEHIMRTNVLLIPASSTFDEVLHMIERSTYSHFPVVDEDGGFAGVIHFNDIHDVIYDPSIRDLVTAVDLADAGAAFVTMGLPMSELLKVFTSHNVGVLAVVDSQRSRRVVGVVEQRDLLKALHTKARRHEGTKARRDGGTQGRRDRGTEPRP